MEGRVAKAHPRYSKQYKPDREVLYERSESAGRHAKSRGAWTTTNNDVPFYEKPVKAGYHNDLHPKD